MGVTVDSFLGIINTPLEEFNIDKNEVEKVFLIPVKYFLENEPEKYSVRVEIHPTDTDENGNILITFPVKELDLPERYHSPWQIKNQKIFVYKTPEGVIWGLTAVLTYEVVKRIKSIL